MADNAKKHFDFFPDEHFEQMTFQNAEIPKKTHESVVCLDMAMTSWEKHEN